MDTLRYKNYNGEIEYKGSRFLFSRAALSDAGRIARMYQDIAVNAENYKTRLNPASDKSFARVGGMFEIHTMQSIEAEIISGRTFFAVLKDAGGEIVSSFWFSPENKRFEGFSRHSGCECQDCAYISALREGNAVYPMELIVSAANRLPGAAHAMFYTIFYIMRQNGYTHSLCDVYCVRGYKDGEKEVELNMVNERSFSMVERTGGNYIGTSSDFEVHIQPIIVRISRKIFCFNYEKILPLLARKLNDIGMNIKFTEGAPV